MVELVPFECSACGLVCETFASAEVICRCGRRCTSSGVGAGTARPGEEASYSRQKPGQKCWSERRGFAETAVSAVSFRSSAPGAT
jgi:hypothetical protein